VSQPQPTLSWGGATLVPEAAAAEPPTDWEIVEEEPYDVDEYLQDDEPGLGLGLGFGPPSVGDDEVTVAVVHPEEDLTATSSRLLPPIDDDAPPLAGRRGGRRRRH